MRDRESWHMPVSGPLTRLLDEEHRPGSTPQASQLCQVELGLRLLEKLAPEHSAEGVWTLLGGYPFARAAAIARTTDDERLLAVGRHLLWPLRRRRAWFQALDTYRDVPQRLRGYLVPPGAGPARRYEPAILAARFDVYDAALAAPPAFVRRPLPLAAPGPSTFYERRRPTSVTFPSDLTPEPATGHDLAGGSPGTGARLTIPKAELGETAQWMEKCEAERGATGGDWVRRLADLHLSTRSADGRGFDDTEELTLDRLVHLVGMVGAGKSTLMILVSVWAARRGLRTTLVVGDVAEQLRLAALFRSLGLPATPMVGPTTRQTHVQRLHRRLAGRGDDNLLRHDDPGFDDMSTVCVADALRGTEAAEPLRYADAPCDQLYPEADVEPDTGSEANLLPPGPYRPREGSVRRPRRGDDTPRLGKRHGCPLWSVCPRHKSARELVDSLIWVANPAALVLSAVPNQLNEERLRHLELACLRSDIVIVDEVDRVQMQLDDLFAPAATLVTRGPESWLDQLHTHKIGELSNQGRLPLTEREIERWAACLDVVGIATNRLYAMLIADPDLGTWVDTDYFSAWTLQEKLLEDWYPSRRTTDDLGEGALDERELYEQDDEVEEAEAVLCRDSTGNDGGQPWSARRAEVRGLFDIFRDDPLGDHGPYDSTTDLLVRSTQDLMHTLNEPGSRQRLRVVLDHLLAGSPAAEAGPSDHPNQAQHMRGDGRSEDPADTHGSPQWYERTARRLTFTLLLAALHQRLDRLVWLWPMVEAALHLEATGNELSRRPPLDYAPLVPEAPMGNVLGFQYLPDEWGTDADPDGLRSGTLRFFRCAGIGRELLLTLPELGADAAAGRPGPHVLLMSGTSWAGASTRAHVLAPVDMVLKPDQGSLDAIRRTVFRTAFLYDENNRALSVSGRPPKLRGPVLATVVTRLAGPRPSGALSPLEEELGLIEDPERKRALLLVGSYKEATSVADQLQSMDRWNGRVRVLSADDADLNHGVHDAGLGAETFGPAAAVRRGDVATFAEDPEAELLIAPLLAVERGHNILNHERKAAFGSVLFLVRPHPRPDDLSLAIFAINDWAARFVRDHPNLPQGTFGNLVTEAVDLDAAGLAFRQTSRREWRRLLSRRYMYSRLDKREKESFAWDQLVTVWQVIGRLVRGGVPARVVFVDARFAPALAASLAPGGSPGRPGRADEGLLARMQGVLEPYFDPHADPNGFADPADPVLVRMLYAPLYAALRELHGRPLA
ncbi:hypothetical protein [Streptomyces sp. SID3343]|uniref:pPIWI_RE_Z domain-containing protein n=1 Tax=Streptomyces sp. SID3343 TaxID=2690260 RepID=UPI001370CC2C|nr:hypothetical protein [Streptomyces sp. SID3343]MYW05300.1 hypothetical protein [Streptomyces sp. SID3343]